MTPHNLGYERTYSKSENLTNLPWQRWRVQGFIGGSSHTTTINARSEREALVKSMFIFSNNSDISVCLEQEVERELMAAE